MARTVFWTLLAAPLVLIAASPILAQDLSSGDQLAIRQALDRGTLLYALDQAAWHGTDAMQAEAKAQGRYEAIAARIGGWIVRKADDGTLDVMFYDRDSTTPRPVYLARMADGGKRLVSSTFFDENAMPLDALTTRLIRAREAALDRLDSEPMLRCADAPYNTAVLPPESPGASIPVYILTPQTDLQHVPVGGHTRIMVGSDGKTGSSHAFTKTCMDLPTGTAAKAPKAIAMTHVLDQLPTEIDVFTVFAAGLPLYVGTPDKRLWIVEVSSGQARIRLLPAN